MPLILAVEVTDGVQLTPDGSWESAYHHAIGRVRRMHSWADDVTAIEGDFIVQMRTFNGDEESDQAWCVLYYVSLPVNFGREVQMEHAQLEVFDHDTILAALQCVAIQRVEKCAICRDRMELKVLAKTSGPGVVVDWAEFRRGAVYLEEEDEEGSSEDEVEDEG
jgi:hypothetical protein